MSGCQLCPRLCGVERSQTASSGGVLPGACRSPLHCVVARAGLHFWEEPVISGTRGSGTVFFSGCNLHCVFCQNYDISSRNFGTEISVAQLRDIYLRLIQAGAHNVNLVTPTHFTESILESLAEPLPVPVVYNTNGYDLPETISRYAGKVQIFLPDFKYADNDLAFRYSGVRDYFERAAAAIEAMIAVAGPCRFDSDGMMLSGTIIRHLILPGQIMNTMKVIHYVADHFPADCVMFSLMRQYLPCGLVDAEHYQEINRRLTGHEYRKVERALLASGIQYGYFQEASSACREFIPLFDNSGVL